VSGSGVEGGIDTEGERGGFTQKKRGYSLFMGAENLSVLNGGGWESDILGWESHGGREFGAS